MDVVQLIQAGKSMGLEGEALQAWTQEQQNIDRDKRAEDRNATREKDESEKRLEREKIELKREKAERKEKIRREKIQIKREQAERNERIELELLQIEREKIALDREKHERNQSATFHTSLPLFNEEKDKFDAYIHRFESYARSMKWPKTDWPMQLSMMLTGNALETYCGLPTEQQKVYEDVKEALMRRYSLTEEGFRRQLFNSPIRAGETPVQFTARLERLLDNWVESSRAEKTYNGLKNLLLREEFLKRCRPSLKSYLREKSEKDIGKLATLAQHYLDSYGGRLGGTGEQKPGTEKTKDMIEEVNPRELVPECEICKKPGHVMKDCWFRDQEDGVKRCFRCGSNEHFVKNCTQKKEPVSSSVIFHSIDQTRKSPIQKYETLDADEISKALNIPLSKGKVNGENVLVMRDSGFNFAAVCAKYVKPEQYLSDYEEVMLMDCTLRRFQKAKIFVETVFYTGDLEVFVVDYPVVDLVFGNVKSMAVQHEEVKEMNEDNNSTRNVDKTQDVVDETNLRTDDTQTIKASSAAVTRSEAKRRSLMSPLVVPELDMVDRETFKELQRDDRNLRKYWNMVRKEPSETRSGRVYFKEKMGLLYRIFEPKGEGNTAKQLLVPQKLVQKVLAVAHDGLLSGHCGIKRTCERVMSNFYWKQVSDDVRRYCRSCAICQKTLAKGRHGKAPLQKMPIIRVPFQRVAVDLVGPIVPCSDRGHRFIITIVDYASRYPEAEVLKNIDTISVAEALVRVFCRVGFPEEILTDQGSQFMSDIMKEVNRLLSMKQLRTTAWHPMCNGLVERFNGTLKTILKRLCAESPKEWDRYLPAVLFAYRSTRQDSIGFTPFELLFGRKVRGPMEILKAYWAKEEQEDEVKTVYQYVVDLKTRLEDTCNIAQEELLKAQDRQKKYFDRRAKFRALEVGKRVLLLLPTKANKLLLQWRGPYNIIQKLSPVNYKIQVGAKQKVYHVNMLKEYHERKQEDTDGMITDDGVKSNLSMVAATLVLKDGVGDETDSSELIEVCPLTSTESWRNVKISQELTKAQQDEVKIFLESQDKVLTTLPGSTTLEKHVIRLTTKEPIRDKIYPIPYSLRKTVAEEVASMLKMGVIRKSKSPYAAPPVLVKKRDGSVRFCVNYKKINSVTVFDGEPMPSPDDVYVSMRGKRFRSKLDLTKGYWQISMEENSVEKTAFVTPDGVYEFVKLPFGLKNSAASFNRLMRLVLGGIKGVGCFVDDVCLYSDTWDEHMDLLKQVFRKLQQAGLTIRPSKCMVGYGLVEFVGHRVGFDTLHLRSEKVKDILEVSSPQTKREVKAFLAMAGYYGKFIPQFADLSYPLTELTKRDKTFRWEKMEEEAFQAIRKYLSTQPVLKIVDFDRVMYVQTDASDVGIGAALLQKYNDVYHPVKFVSRKLKPAEKNYSTIEKEGLAIVWSVEKLMIFLYGREFVLLTDHRPLTFIQLSKMHNSRVMRWSMFLQDWSFHVESIKGTDNVVADYLSRS